MVKAGAASKEVVDETVAKIMEEEEAENVRACQEWIDQLEDETMRLEKCSGPRHYPDMTGTLQLPLLIARLSLTPFEGGR